MSAVDLDSGWIDYARPKTGIERRFPLWPETVAAIQAVLEIRQPPRDSQFADVLLVTKYGSPWHLDGRNDIRWTFYGAILGLVGVAEIVWSALRARAA